MRPRSPRVPLRAHLWLGTVAALPLAVVAATGIVIGFFDLLRYASPPYRLSAPVTVPLAPGELLAHAEAAFAATPVARLDLPSSPDRAAIATSAGPEPRRAFLDPATGRVVAIGPAHRDWLEAARALHHGVLFGEIGRWIATASAVAAVALWLLGDRVRARRPPRGAPPPRAGLRLRMLALHRRLGWMGGILLVALAITGALLNHVGSLRVQFLPEPRVTTPALPVDVRAAIAIGAAAYAGSPLDRIEPPRASGAALRLRFHGGARVYVDAAERRVLAVHDEKHPLVLLYPVHSGRVFGRAGPPAVAAVGALGFVILATGACHHARARTRRRASGC